MSKHIIKEYVLSECTYICHILNPTYREGISLDAFIKRNMNNIINKKTNRSFMIITTEDIAIDYKLSNKWEFHPRCNLTIHHNNLNDFFKYIDYDIKLNKKRI